MEVGSGSKSGSATGRTYDTKEFCYRTADGKCNHPSNHVIGSRGTFFGRNMPPSSSNYGLMDPHPSVVATKLLARKKFTDTGEQFNMIATSWIQFMIHDWIDHLEDTQQVNQFILCTGPKFVLAQQAQKPKTQAQNTQPKLETNKPKKNLKTTQAGAVPRPACLPPIVELRAPHEIASACPLKSFKFFKTKRISTGEPDMKDGSVIYGNNEEGMRRVRAFKEGKLRIGGDGLLEHDEKWIPISGDVRNCWAGFSLLQVREHNAVCDMLKEHYPDLDDEKLYRYARLVTSAVIAKIHNRLDSRAPQDRHSSCWDEGQLRFKDLFGHICGPVLSGLVGLRKPNDHGVPYSLTEEFSSVYKMHSLLPDKVILRDITNSTNPNYECPPVSQEVPMTEMTGKEGERRMSKIGMEQMLVSMGHQASGAVTLWNYPSWMRNLIPHDINGEEVPDPVDMSALEIYRDRERGVARYNEFRRNLLMIPISKWEDLTDDCEVIEALSEVYGEDVEKLDLLVGLQAEKKIKGFAISETAFFIFLLIASRRLEADRFFTTNFNPKTYTEKGLEWVNKTETLKDVIDRHFPDMTAKWMRCSSAFSVWSAPPDKTNYIPLYLRPAT
ncbi:hypothetical protein CXB51_022954 [Gossypium anomalum]|uniref:Alpha-dioxygenase 2 n=1 Tax=Gossypium anomalum TaxID=47600 RepID=A0A8J6CXZ4_9ROSI|nr:hypothetical protein CXB51_022954 [Gossypium anomalum]